MKKNLSIIAIFAIVFCSCSEDILQQNDLEEILQTTNHYTNTPPLRFNSIEDLSAAIKDYPQVLVRSSNNDFTSFAETIMTESDYDNRPNAIFSEAFGSVLNQDGEVIFGETLIKVGSKGLLFGPVTQTEEIRILAKDESILNLCVKRQCPYHKDMNNSYVISGHEKIFLYDTFENLSDETSADDIFPLTKSNIIWAQQGEKVGPNMDVDFVWPRSQKNYFYSNNKIANDTKIYRQKYAVYSEAGVKTKTMRKRGLFWKKFSAPVTSAITNISIWEGGHPNTPNFPLGWLDINKTHYKGESFIIATKVVSSYASILNSELNSECNDAKAWAKSEGKSINIVDGIRYLIQEDPNNAVTKIKDRIVTKYDSKNTLIFNLNTGWNNFYTEHGLFNNLSINNNMYRVDLITFSGYSEYNNEKRGSILRCHRF